MPKVQIDIYNKIHGERGAEKYEKSLKSIEDRAKKIGKGMTVAGAAIVGAFGLAIRSAVKFNEGMASVATLIPKSGERIKELKGNVQDLAIATGKSTDDLTNGLYQVVSAFGDSADSAEILEVNARAAAAGMATTTDSINLTSAVMKGYGDVSVEATKRTADLAFQTVKLGQTTFPELAASMGKVIPIGAKLKVSQEELFAGYATLTGVTGSAAEVTTQLRGVMASMMKPTADMAKAIEHLEFKSAEAMIAELGLQGSLEALIGTTDGSTTAVGKLFANIESLPAVFALSGSQADIFKEKLDAMKESSGAMEEAFTEMSEGINAAGFNMQRLQQMATVLAQKIGDKLAPTIGRLALSVGKALMKITDWMDKHPKLTEIIIKAALGVGVLMAALGPLLIALPGLLKALPLVAKGFTKLLSPIGLLSGSLLIIAERLNAARVAFIETGKEIDAFMAATGSELSGYQKFLFKLETGVSKLIGTHSLYAKGLSELNVKTAEATAANVAYGQKVWDSIKGTETYSKVTGLLGKVFGTTKEDIKDTGNEISGNLNPALKKQIEILSILDPKISAYGLAIKSVGETAVPVARDLNDILDQAPDKFDDAAKAAQAFGDDTVETIDIMETRWGDLISNIGTASGNFLDSLLDETTTWKQVTEGLLSDLKASFRGILADMLSDWVKNFLGGLVSSAAGATGDVVNSLKSTASAAMQGIGSVVSGGLTNIIGGVVAGLGSLIAGQKTKGAIDATNRALEKIWFNTQNLENATLHNIVPILDDIKKTGWALYDFMTKGGEKSVDISGKGGMSALNIKAGLRNRILRDIREDIRRGGVGGPGRKKAPKVPGEPVTPPGEPDPQGFQGSFRPWIHQDTGQKAGDQIVFYINAVDAKSFDSYLRNEGKKPVLGFIKRNKTRINNALAGNR